MGGGTGSKAAFGKGMDEVGVRKTHFFFSGSFAGGMGAHWVSVPGGCFSHPGE